MKLVDMLEMSDRDTLKKIAKSHHIKFDNIVWFHSDRDKNEPYSRVIYKKFTLNNYMDEFIDKLDKRYKDVLAYIFFGIFKIRNFNDYKTAETLKQMGLIYLEKEFNNYEFNGYVCEMPDEIRSIFKNHIDQSIISENKIEPDPTPAYNMLKDMITVMFFIRSNFIKLKQNGEIFKKSLEKMKNLIVVNNNIISDLNEYILITLINSCFRFGIVYNDENVLKVDLDLLNKFMELPYKSKVNLITGIIIYSWFYTNMNDNSEVNVLRNLKILLNNKAGSININEFFKMMRNSGMTENEENKLLLVFMLLDYIGVIKVQDFNGVLFMSFQDAVSCAENKVKIYIQPNYEIYIPPYVNLNVLYNVCMYAEPVKMDKSVSIYKINKDYVLFSLRHGKTYQNIIDELTDLCVELPQNVAYTLKDWANTVDAAYYVDCMLLRIKDPNMAETVKSKIKNYIIMEISPNDFAIYKDKYKEVTIILNKLGFVPYTIGLNEKHKKSQEEFENLTDNILKNYDISNWFD